MLKIIFILALISAVTCCVYFTGGTAAAFTHLMYIPIIVSAFYFGITGAVCAAVVGDLALGPWMPKYVALRLMQDPSGWIFRMVIFAVVGIIVAVLFNYIRTYKKTEIERSYVNIITGLPNMNKLKADLDEMVRKNAPFFLIGFRVMNIDDINRYTDYETGIKAIKAAAQVLKGTCGTVYSIFTNEFAVILPGSDIEEAKSKAAQFLNEMCLPVTVGQFNIKLILSGGIVHYPLQAGDAGELIRKAGIALGRKSNGSGLFVYDSAAEQISRKRANIISCLFDAIKNGEFHMVYQPKRGLHGEDAKSVEALIRWDRGMEMQVNTGEFIQIAEEIGVIGDITKWVIREVIGQIKKWRDEGLQIKVALNISPRDLGDRSVIDYLTAAIEENALEPSMIEIELTERGILDNEKNASVLLNILREKGIEISLDDFGTGYNSLIDIIKIPIDNVKIDKVFIDNFTDEVNKILIVNIIDFAHKTGKKVIAEGVEKKEQLDMLAGLGCDYIQGYYFSKPLPPGEIKNFMCSRK